MSRLLKVAASGILIVGTFLSVTTPVSFEAEFDVIEQAVLASADQTSYDYSKYNKDSLEELQKTVEEKGNEAEGQDVLVYKKWSQEIDKALQHAGDEGESVDSVYALQERAAFEAEMLSSTDAETSKVVQQAMEDVERYEAEIRQKEEEEKKVKEAEEAQKAVQANISWSDSFRRTFTQTGVTAENAAPLKSIDIYEYFPEGVYSSPVDMPSLSRVSEGYTQNNPGIQILMTDKEPVLSVAKGTVSFEDETLVLKCSDNVEVRYNNVQSLLKNGDQVDSGDKLGVYSPDALASEEIRSILDAPLPSEIAEAEDEDENEEERKKEIPSYEGKGISIELRKNGNSVPSDWVMTEFPFITNNGMSMPLYRQDDELWGDNPYGGTDIAEAGCGPSAMAMAFSYLKNEIITPADVVNKMGGADSPYWTEVGSLWSSIDEVTEMYGLKVKRINANQVRDALKANHPVIAIMGPGQFTNAGHFITLSGIADSGNILVNDSYDNIKKKHYDSEFSLDSIAAENRGCFWEISL